VRYESSTRQKVRPKGTLAFENGLMATKRTHSDPRAGIARRRWPYRHTYDTYFHMKATLNIDDSVVAELKREAARKGRTMSELVESALRQLLRSHRKRQKIVALLTFRSGGTLVDIADREALYQAMEGR